MVLYLTILKPLDDRLNSECVVVKHNHNKINTDSLIHFILCSFIFILRKLLLNGH
jgi:hypothetical protein